MEARAVNGRVGAAQLPISQPDLHSGRFPRQRRQHTPPGQPSTEAASQQSTSHVPRQAAVPMCSLEYSSCPLMAWLSILPIVLYGTFCGRAGAGRPPGGR